MKAPELLQNAANIMAERGKQYDKPEGERSMGKCVAAFNIITDKTLTEAEGWLLLQLLKDVRQWQRPGYHQDSAEDCIAYAALKAEAKQQEQVTETGFIPAFLAKKSGSSNVKTATKSIDSYASALRVIRTWASVDGALNPDHVLNLCDKTLGD